MELFTKSQKKILLNFFSNMAVVWFTASFIGATDIGLMFRYALSGLLALATSLRLVEEANET